MKIKINRWEFDVTNNDWILDNGSLYQCMTLKHRTGDWLHPEDVTIMSKKQFNQLIKDGLLCEFHNGRLKSFYSGCRFWHFVVKEEN